MTASNFAVTITDTPTLILEADNINKPIWLQIIGNHTVYIGDNSSVSTSNGFPLVKHSAPLTGGLGIGQPLYGICSAGQTEQIRVFAVRD
jgi:hypothetical protein